MKKRFRNKLIILVFLYICASILTLTLVIITINHAFFRYSCKSVAHENGIVYSSDGEKCGLGAKICNGMTCVAPAITADCNETREVCGIQYTCKCD
jgi:hypothetical protein